MKRKLSLLLTLLMVITMIPFNASHAVSTNYVDRVVSVKDTADLSTDSNMPSLVIKNSGKTFQSNENFDLELGAKAEWLDAIEGRSYFVGAEGQNLGLATGVGGTNAQGTVVFKDGAVASDLIAALAAKGQSATLVGTDARLVNGGKITVRVAGEGFNRVYTTVVEGTNVPAPTVPTIEQIFANGYIQVSDGTRVTFQLNADKTGGKLIQGTATKAQMDEAVAIFDQAMKNAGYGGGGFGGGSATTTTTFTLEKVYTKADGTIFTLEKVYTKAGTTPVPAGVRAWILEDPVATERDLVKLPIQMTVNDFAKFNNAGAEATSLLDRNTRFDGRQFVDYEVRVAFNEKSIRDANDTVVTGSTQKDVIQDGWTATAATTDPAGRVETYRVQLDPSKNVKLVEKAEPADYAKMIVTTNAQWHNVYKQLKNQARDTGHHAFEQLVAGSTTGSKVAIIGTKADINEIVTHDAETKIGATTNSSELVPVGGKVVVYTDGNADGKLDEKDTVIATGIVTNYKSTVGDTSQSIVNITDDSRAAKTGKIVILKSAEPGVEVTWDYAVNSRNTNLNTIGKVVASLTDINDFAIKSGAIKNDLLKFNAGTEKEVTYEIKVVEANVNTKYTDNNPQTFDKDITKGQMEAEISPIGKAEERGVIIVLPGARVSEVKDMIKAEAPYYGSINYTAIDRNKDITIQDNEEFGLNYNKADTDEVFSRTLTTVTKDKHVYKYDVFYKSYYEEQTGKSALPKATLRVAPATGGGAFGGGAEMIVSERIDVNGTTGTTTTPASSVGTVTFQKMSKYIVRVTLNANAALSDKFQIEVPMMVKLKGADTGAQKVAIVSRDSAITAGEYTYANVGSSEIAVRVKEVQKIARGDNRSNNVTLIFDELINSAFRQGDQIKLRLPNGFTWNLNTKSNNAGYTAAVNPDNSRELIVTLGAANNSIKETIYVDAVIDASRDARLGNIDVTVTNGKVSPQNLVVAEYVAYNVDLKVDKVLEVIAGRDIPGEYRSRIKISEPVAKAIAASRYIEVSFVDKDGKAVDASLQHGENVEIIGNSFLYIPSQDYLKTSDRGAHVVAVDTGYKKGTDGDMVGTFDLQTAGTLVETAQNYELYLPFVVSTDYTGELFVKFHGAGIDGQVKIADVIAPVSYKVEANTQVKIGLQKQKATDIVVTETKAGALQDFTAETAKYAEYKIVPSKEWFKFVSGSAVVEEGDIIISKSNGDFKRGIKVERKSTKPSTIRFKDMEVTLDRTVPYGGLDLKLNFGQVGMRHDLTNTMATVKDYFFTETPVALDQRVSTIFKIGEPGYTTITGTTAQEHEANVAPFIENGRTMLPVRQVADAVGAITNWDAATKTATFQKDNNTVTIQIDKAQMQVNGNNIPLYAKPANVNDRILLPIANIAQAFGLEHGTEIIWDQDTQTVIILPQNPTATEKEQAFKVAGVKEKKVEAPATSSTEETKAPVTVTP